MGLRMNRYGPPVTSRPDALGSGWMLKLPGRLWTSVHRPSTSAHPTSASAGSDHRCGVNGQISQAISANCAATSNRPAIATCVMGSYRFASGPAPGRALALPAPGSPKELRKFRCAQQAYPVLRSELPRVRAQVSGRHVDALLRVRRLFRVEQFAQRFHARLRDLPALAAQQRNAAVLAQLVIGDSVGDYELRKNGRVTLLGCKRWKVAQTGMEPLRELLHAKQAADAQECIYVAAGDLSPNARQFAAQNGIRLLCAAELAQFLGRAGGGKRKRSAGRRP